MSGETPYRDDDDVVRAGEYTLGLMPDDEAEAFEARLAAEPELRALCAAWASEFAAMTEELDPVRPPARVQAALEQRLFGRARKGPGVLGWLAGMAAVVTAAVILVMTSGLLERGPLPPDEPVYRAEIAAEDGSLLVRAAYDAETARLYLERERGAAPPGRALELWLIAGDESPVSLGVLPTETETVLPIEEPLRPKLDGGLLAISEEPPGGSPTGAPTGDVLAVGPISNV
ncbi:anti-sigma factor [Roseovarius salis]|uniref:anti-sigma factor n=1 Tax=Roseovarius salis TaxID=3376063 RepID=UPI0037CC6F71